MILTSGLRKKLKLIKFNTMIHFKVKPRLANSIPANFDSAINELLKNNKDGDQTQKSFIPNANILEYDDKFEIQLELPGYSRQDIEIQIENKLLIIQKNEKTGNKEKSVNYHLNQIRSGSFRRAFVIPENTDWESIVAKHENGILVIHIPKIESRPLKRSVSIG